MRLLAFETSTPTGGVALLEDGSVTGQMTLAGSRVHSREGLRLAERLLANSNLAWKDLDAVAASHGPGSFTGVRVGLTLIKGLAWSLKIKCVTVSSLEALALHAYSGESVDAVVPLLDARMNEIYGSVYQISGGGLIPTGEEFSAEPRELHEKLKGRRSLFAGEGGRRYYQEHLAHLGLLARPDRLQASPAAVAVLAAQALKKGAEQRPEDIAAIYLRQPVQRRPV